MNNERQPCAQCGLPVITPHRDSQAVYCCLGCELAASLHGSGHTSEEQTSAAVRLGMAVFFSMNVMVFTLALWSWDTYTISDHEHAAVFRDLLRYACALFSAPVLLILGGALFNRALADLRMRRITSDLLLSAGVAAAAIFSMTSLLIGAPHVYFEVVCMLLLATTLGRWLEAEGKQRALNSVASLRNQIPAQARRVSEGSVSLVDLDEIRIGETIRVLPGEHIPLDGTVVRGCSFVDQRMVNGESDPSRVECGHAVFGGSLNQDGALDLRVDATNETGMLQRIIDAVRDAAQQNSPEQKLADRIAEAFVPIVALLATAVFFWHWQTEDIRTSFMTSMSVVLIACPCALGIATPMALWIALNRAATHGIVFRSGQSLSALSRVKAVAIDKTGTLTDGAMQLSDQRYAGDSALARQITRAIAAETQHPLTSALLEQLPDEANPGTSVHVESAKTLPGRGVEARLTVKQSDGTSQTIDAVLGSRRCCRERSNGELADPTRDNPADDLSSLEPSAVSERSAVFLAWQGIIQAGYYFNESLRPESSRAVDYLKRLCLDVILLSGDESRRTEQIAGDLGISFRAGLLPEEKQAALKEMAADGHSVAMVGDGLNDAPALASANVGIALGSGVELSREAADACVISSNIALVPWAIELARNTVWTVRANLFWALIYNLIGIVLAACGRLNPIVAALAMVGSSALVIAQSLRITIPPIVEGQSTVAETKRTAAMPHSDNVTSIAVGETAASVASVVEGHAS